jgi:hypothetical protein
MGEEGNVKIKLRVSGIEVEVECGEGQVEKAVQDVLRGIRRMGKLKSTVEAARRPEVIPTTCKDIIEELWSEGWFSEPRSLGDVSDELARRGYHYARSAVSHALLDMTREGKFSRMGRERKYRYVQKIPIIQPERSS